VLGSVVVRRGEVPCELSLNLGLATPTSSDVGLLKFGSITGQEIGNAPYPHVTHRAWETGAGNQKIGFGFQRFSPK